MSETAKYMVPVGKWVKWTGDNLAEIEAFWSEELAATETTLSVDGTNGMLFCGWALNSSSPYCPVGYWTAPGMGVASDAQLAARYTEVPEEGLMP